MALIKFKRTHKSSNEPIISIYGNRFHYSAFFGKVAELKEYSYVTYYFDEAERKIAFEFTKEEVDDDSYTLEFRQNKIWRSTANEAISRFPWLWKVATFDDREVRKFIARKKEGKWVIQLCPAFEKRISKEEVRKLEDERGIYRYLLDEKVVYIGKGDIKKRAFDPERKGWKYDTIEYSIIDSEKSQYEWEYFWIEKYKDANNRLLPYYNHVSGIKPQETE